MQIKFLPTNVYKLAGYSLRQSNLDEERKKIEKPVHNWEALKKQGVCAGTISEVVGISRATYYRLRKKLSLLNKGIPIPSKRPKNFRQSNISTEIKGKILDIRRQNPTYGKEKISTILQRDFSIKLSPSSVNRVINELKNKGIITKSASAPKAKRRRKWNKHATKWTYGMKAENLGELVQIDHMTVHKNGVTSKHFQAVCPISKKIIAEIYNNAKSRTAKKFLDKVLKEIEFNVVSIQVDGGSEFMKEFEEKCENTGIKLFVIPPKRPQYNGVVERSNRIFREEFYDNPQMKADSIGEIRTKLSEFTKKYNNYRPHHALANLTPNQYLSNITKAA